VACETLKKAKRGQRGLCRAFQRREKTQQKLKEERKNEKTKNLGRRKRGREGHTTTLVSDLSFRALEEGKLVGEKKKEGGWGVYSRGTKKGRGERKRRR